MIKESDWNERYHRPRRRRRRRGCLTRLVTTVLVLGLLVGWLWWQQNGLSSETITVASAPDGFAGYRIAVVSDLHAKEFGEGNRVLLDYVRDLEPDLVAVVGDILHEPDQMSMIPAVAKGLAAIAPTYYVTGNHEWAAGVVRELEPLLEQCGVTVLSNEYVMLERNGDRIALLGAEDSNGYADQKTVQELADQVRQEQGAVYEILLSHRNNHYEQYAQARVELTLAGHAHGGLIRLPGTDGLVGPKRELFPQYTAGLYDLSYGQMVVSRGLGNQFPCFRLLNRPDVPLVVLGCRKKPERKKTQSMNTKQFSRGLRVGVPISLGYLAVSFTLGITAKNAGLSAFQATLTSLLVNASAGQYAAFTMMAAQGGYWEIAILEAVTNARYILMSCALSQKLPAASKLWHRLVIGFNVNDEIFGMAIAEQGKLNPFY